MDTAIDVICGALLSRGILKDTRDLGEFNMLPAAYKREKKDKRIRKMHKEPKRTYRCSECKTVWRGAWIWKCCVHAAWWCVKSQKEHCQGRAVMQLEAPDEEAPGIGDS